MKSAAVATAARPCVAGDPPPPVAASERESLFDALRRRRDRLLADGRFQRFATAFVFTRPIARARSRALFDLVAGFVYSQVLYACVTLGLLRRLLERPQAPAELAQALSIPLDRLERLLSAAAADNSRSSRSSGNASA